MGFIRDLHLELHELGSNATELAGQDGRTYFAHNFLSFVSGDQSRGFIELTSPKKNDEGTDYFLMEIGGSDISIAIREGGSSNKERLLAFATNYFNDDFRERGIDPKRLSPMEPETFEQSAKDVLKVPANATIASKSHAIREGHAAIAPATFHM